MMLPVIDALTTPSSPRKRPKPGDDELGRVAKRGIQEPADARADAARRATRSPRRSGPRVG